jgi:hypothetical protein
MVNFKSIYLVILFLSGLSLGILFCKKEVDPFLQPIVSLAVDSITSTSAVLRGGDLHYGVGKLNEYKCGFYWDSSAEEPSANDNIIVGNLVSAYHFRAKLLNLIPGQIYHVKAYVVNSYASAKSEVVSFVTMIN